MSIVVEEADETLFWIEILIESGIISKILMKDIKREANEILAIMATAIKNTSNSKSQ